MYNKIEYKIPYMSENAFLDPRNLKIFEEYSKNVKWFMDNFESVRNENRGKVVAVYNEQIVASDRNPEILLKQLEDQGITNIDSVFRKYIPETDDLLVV
jgi:hypothetical protein